MAPLQRSTPMTMTMPMPTPTHSQPSQPDQQLQIQHFIHPHLIHKLFMAFEFNCDGCKKGGHGVRYRCSACDFDLHEHCATAPYHLSSHIHPQHQITLVNRPGVTSHFCDVCKGFTDGLSYTCQTCEFDVHINCTPTPVATGVPKVTMDPSQQQGGVTWAQPTHHSQPVMMMNQMQQGVPMTTTTSYGCKPVMVNQQQLFGVNNNNNNYSNNQGVMMSQQQQQQQWVSTTVYGGYYNQPVMMNQNQNQYQQQQQQQQQQGNKSSTLANVGKIAASVLMTSLIGVPLNFNSKSR